MTALRLLMAAFAAALPWTADLWAEQTREVGVDSLPIQKSVPLLVTVEDLRVPDKEMAALGFDWMLPKHSEKSGAQLCGSFLKSQYAIVKRSLNAIKPPVVWGRETRRVVSGEFAVETRWAERQPAFVLQLERESDGATVSLQGTNKTATVTVDFAAWNNVLLFAIPSPENGWHELYFVTIDRVSPGPPTKNKAPGIEIAVRLAQVSEDLFIKHEKELQDAVRAGDLKPLDALRGVDIMNLPMVTTNEGQTATINVIREYRYPVDFEPGADAVLTPTEFQTANLGVTFTANATKSEGKIQLRGELVVRQFEGMARGDLGAFAPAFQSTEANVFRALNDGQTAGFWLPGVRMVRKSEGFLSDVMSANRDFLSPPDPKASVRYKLALMVTTRVAKLESAPLLPLDPVLGDVKAYDVTETHLGRKYLGANKVAAPAYVLGEMFSEWEGLPPAARELPVTKDSKSRSVFKSPLGTNCQIEASSSPLQALVSITPATNENPPREPKSYVTMLTLIDNDQALMVSGNGSDAKSEALLLVFQKKSRERVMPKDGSAPFGTPVPGKPGFIISPYSSTKGYIDVRGYKPGVEVKDPYSGKMIRVP